MLMIGWLTSQSEAFIVGGVDVIQQASTLASIPS